MPSRSRAVSAVMSAAPTHDRTTAASTFSHHPRPCARAARAVHSPRPLLSQRRNRRPRSVAMPETTSLRCRALWSCPFSLSRIAVTCVRPRGRPGPAVGRWRRPVTIGEPRCPPPLHRRTASRKPLGVGLVMRVLTATACDRRFAMHAVVYAPPVLCCGAGPFARRWGTGWRVERAAVHIATHGCSSVSVHTVVGWGFEQHQNRCRSIQQPPPKSMCGTSEGPTNPNEGVSRRSAWPKRRLHWKTSRKHFGF